MCNRLSRLTMSGSLLLRSKCVIWKKRVFESTKSRSNWLHLSSGVKARAELWTATPERNMPCEVWDGNCRMNFSQQLSATECSMTRKFLSANRWIKVGDVRHSTGTSSRYDAIL